MLAVNRAIADASEQSYKVTTLQTRGLLDADACAVRLRDIEVRLTELRRERRRLLKNEDVEEVREMFQRVQEEMARRTSKRKVMQKTGKTEQGKYSAKYALSELLICGECGSPYKRCTPARAGRKKSACAAHPLRRHHCGERLPRASVSRDRLRFLFHRSPKLQRRQ